MEKTMFDFWEEEITKAQELLAKIKGYSRFDIHINNIKGCPPIGIIMKEEEEVERLKSIPYPQPPLNEEVLQNRIDELKQEKIKLEAHRQNLETIDFEHKNRMELEALRNRRAFDEKSTEDLQNIFSMSRDLKDAGISEPDIQKNKRYAAIYWCHQQAALLPTNTYAWQVDNSQNVLKSIDITANYLFKTFFPDLQQE